MKKTFIFNKSIKKNLSTNPGIYIFKNSSDKAIYIGKAKNLKNRINSYFSTSLINKTARMIDEAKTITYIEVATEFEALLLEAKLVRKLKPHYNSALKDDKSPLYIGITKEELPRVLELRQTDLKLHKLQNTYGPFINSYSVVKILKYLKKIFPYSIHKPGGRACVRSQIGLCSPCPSDIVNEKDLQIKSELIRKYRLNIRRVRAVLNGKLPSLIATLEKELKVFSKEEKYEEASERLRQIRFLDRIAEKPINVDGYLEDPNLIEDIHESELQDLKKIISKFIDVDNINRIECYDVAHLAGNFPTASMVTFIGAAPEKAFYRHFKIKLEKGNSDVDSMQNVLERRKHYLDKWGIPDLIIVDGGKGQVKKAIEVMGGIAPVVGLAKREETLVFKIDEDYKEYKLPNGPAKNLVQRIRDEAHRFARRLHHKQVSKALLESR